MPRLRVLRRKLVNGNCLQSSYKSSSYVFIRKDHFKWLPAAPFFLLGHISMAHEREREPGIKQFHKTRNFTLIFWYTYSNTYSKQ